MAICTECSVDFHALEADGRPCKKCALIAAHDSDIDKDVIRGKAQCKSCSLVYSQLRVPLCHRCCQTYATGNSPIPGAIAQLAGAVDQILSLQSSESTSDLWGLVRGHKQNVSQHRLGTPRAQNPSLLKAVAAKSGMSGIGTGATSKSLQYIQDLKDKREQGEKVKFNVSTAKSVSRKNGASSFVLMPEVRFIELFNDQDHIDLVLDTIVVRAQEYHAHSHTAAAKIFRSMVTFYAVISTANTVRISIAATTDGTALTFLKHFKKQNYISAAQFNSKNVFIRLVVDAKDLDLDDALTMTSGIPASQKLTASGRARKSLASAAPGDLTSLSGPQVRKSAYVPHRAVSQAPPPAPRFSRNPPMFVGMFKRYASKPKNERTEFSIPQDAEWEPIQIAMDWRDGLKKSKNGEAFYDTGYIGTGSTKQVIYARIGSEEYALGQSSDEDYYVTKHHDMLVEELRNLEFGEAMRQEFESLALERNVALPRFRFHTGGAFLGMMQPLSDSSVDADARLPHLEFIATRLLPCGPAHKPIQKFTGNDDCGPAPTDDLTMALHAFTHFVAVYTNSDVILCDLQGMYEGKTMVLIDPQMHTSVVYDLFIEVTNFFYSAEPERDKRMYWDNGPEAIRRFMELHLQVCSDNSICNRLDLQNVRYEVDPDFPEAARPVTPPPAQRNVRSRSLSTSPIQRKRRRSPLRHGFPSPK